MTKAPHPRTPALKFNRMLAWLMVEVMYGKAQFKITRGLTKVDPAVVEVSPRFFELAIGAHADAALLAASRIFDGSRGVSIHRLLDAALAEAGTFKLGTAAEVRKAVAEAKASLVGVAPKLSALRTRRNETIAHADARPLVDPQDYIVAGRISYIDFESLFLKVESILYKLSKLYRGASVELELKDWNDYEQAFDLIADAKCEQARRYEAEHNTPAPFPLPRKCSERSIP